MNYQALYKFFLESQSEAFYNFKMGFMGGVLVFFVLAILTRIIFLFYVSRLNLCKGISIKGANGKIFISASAVADLVRLSSSSFNEIRIEKIALINDKDFLSIDLQISIMNGKDPLTMILESLQAKILETLSDRLGVNSVKSVNIKVKKVVSAVE